MKHVILLIYLLVASNLASAQAPHSVARSDSLAPAVAAAPAVPDTVAALHRLFAAKRRKLAFILIGTATAELVGQTVVGTTVPGGGIIDDRAITQFAVALLTVPVVVAEVLFYAQYNQKHEARAVEDFQLHRLPRHLRRQLKAKYFH